MLTNEPYCKKMLIYIFLARVKNALGNKLCKCDQFPFVPFVEFVKK